MSRITGDRSCMGIGSHKSAAAEKYTAKIARYNNADIGKSAFFQYIKNRNTCSALRFSVVGISGNIILAEDIRIHIMLGFSVLGFDRIDKCYSFVISPDRGDIADKLRAFFYERSLCVCGNSEIVHNKLTLLTKSPVNDGACDLLVHIETLLKSVNASACINKLLLTSIERMAL